MKKIKIKASGLLSIMLFMACVYDPQPEKLNVYNNSDLTVYALYSCYNDISEERPPLKLLDTTYSKTDNKMNIISPDYCFSEYSIYKGGLYNQSWKEYIKNCEDKTLKVFFIDERVMKSKRWKEIINNKLFLKKMEFTYNQLEEQNWLIEFTE